MIRPARAIGILALALSAAVVSSTAAAKSVPVSIEGMKFSAPKLEISVGDTVVWTNSDIVPHTVTSKTNAFSSGLIDTTSGKNSWKHTFKKKGTFPYVCSFHPVMSAEVIVK